MRRKHDGKTERDPEPGRARPPDSPSHYSSAGVAVGAAGLARGMNLCAAGFNSAIARRASFHARWTTHDMERSSRRASAAISSNISAGK
jgi:hypothetical protein